MSHYICRWEEDVDTIWAESMIEAIMKFYQEYEIFPDEVSERREGEIVRNYEQELGKVGMLLDTRTKERDYAVQKLHDVYHAVKEAMSTERP